MGKSIGEGAMADDHDDPREAAMAAAPALHPDFLSSRVTRGQIDKLKELHQRRLKMKQLVSSKSQKNSKGVKEASTKKIDADLQQPVAHASMQPTCITDKNEDSPSYPWRKRQKLHWGNIVNFKTRQAVNDTLLQMQPPGHDRNGVCPSSS